MDIEGTMQFILDRQAQSSSDVIRIYSLLEGVAERQNKLEQIVLEMGHAVLNVTNTQQHASEVLATLAERQVATEEALSRLAERQGTTEENLNVLLLTVERHISNHN